VDDRDPSRRGRQRSESLWTRSESMPVWTRSESPWTRSESPVVARSRQRRLWMAVVRAVPGRRPCLTLGSTAKGEALATAARGQQPSREPLAAASEAIAVGAFPRPCKWYRAALDDSSSDRRAAGMPHARSPVRGFVASRITPLARWHDEHWLTAVVITVLDEIRVAVDDRDPTGYPD
jgi:hypothetical protein